MTNVDTTTAAAPPPRGRLILGGAIFMVGLLCPLLIPLVAASNLPAGWKATLSGVLLLGIPELFMLTAAGGSWVSPASTISSPAYSLSLDGMSDLKW